MSKKIYTWKCLEIVQSLQICTKPQNRYFVFSAHLFQKMKRDDFLTKILLFYFIFALFYKLCLGPQLPAGMAGMPVVRPGAPFMPGPGLVINQYIGSGSVGYSTFLPPGSGSVEYSTFWPPESGFAKICLSQGQHF